MTDGMIPGMATNDMYTFRRTIKVRAVRLDAESLLVRGNVANAGDWLVFEDGMEKVFRHEDFVRLYAASTEEAKRYFASQCPEPPAGVDG